MGFLWSVYHQRNVKNRHDVSFGVHNQMASWIWLNHFFHDFGSLFWPGNAKNSTSLMYVYLPRFHPSDLHWWTQHQSLESLGLSIFTVNDVVFTFKSGVATQTGSNDACSLFQMTWSIHENKRSFCRYGND